jgi:hypothetical protein
LSVIIDIGRGTFVCVVREAHESGGSVSAGDSPGIHFPEDHPGGFD